MTFVRLATSLGLSSVLLTSCDAPTSPDAATRSLTSNPVALTERPTVQHFWFDADYTFFSRCAQEEIQLSGREYSTLMTLVQDGKTTYRFFGNTPHLTGVGLTSGARYIFAITSAGFETYYNDPPFAIEFRYGGGGQVTVVPGEGKWTRIQVITTGVYDGTTLTEITRRFVDDCPGVTPESP